jgi:hypothetical protein
MTMESGENDLLTPHEAATRLRVKVSWVYAHADELGALRVGKYLRFRWAHVLACVAEGSCQRRPHSRVGGGLGQVPFPVAARSDVRKA